jgi:hypothetical protein
MPEKKKDRGEKRKGRERKGKFKALNAYCFCTILKS